MIQPIFSKYISVKKIQKNKGKITYMPKFRAIIEKSYPKP